MRYERDGWSISSGNSKKRSPPQWYLDEPEALPEDDFWREAFTHLNTETGENLVIPYSKIVEYADRQELEKDLADALVIVIYSMSRVYRDWVDKERERKLRR